MARIMDASNFMLIDWNVWNHCAAVRYREGTESRPAAIEWKEEKGPKVLSLEKQ